MDPDRVAAHVRERSGLDVQAVTLIRSGGSDEPVPWVWAAMTERGHFWAVENESALELFRAVARQTSPDDLLTCHSAVEAARRFLVLTCRAGAGGSSNSSSWASSSRVCSAVAGLPKKYPCALKLPNSASAL